MNVWQNVSTISASDNRLTYDSVPERNEQCGNIGSVRKDRGRHEGIFGELLLTEDEEHAHYSSKDDQADDLGRAPRKDLAAKVQAKQQHQSQSEYRDAPEPIDGLDTIDYARLRVVHVEEDEKQDESRPAYRQVDPEAPAPREKFGKGSAENGPDAGSQSPHELRKTEE